MSFTSGCSSVPSAAKAMVGNEAPYVRLTMLDGTSLPLEAYRGKHLALIFWATWCGHSRSTIADFEALAEKYKNRRNIQFVGVSVDKSEYLTELKGRIKSQELNTMTHAFSGNDIQDESYLAFHGEILPYIVVIDPQGIVRVVASGTGPLEDYLEHL